MEEAVIINNVVLTQKAIDRLRSYQEMNNNGAKIANEVISDAICLIAFLFQSATDEKQKEASGILADLSSVRDDIKTFMKP
jgi:hypothetical protein